MADLHQNTCRNARGRRRLRASFSVHELSRLLSIGGSRAGARSRPI